MKIILLICMALILVGCSQDQEQSQKSPVGTYEEGDTASGLYPLTGEEMQTANDQRAVSVVLNNHPNARPQSGLAEADVVYEILAEGKITRLLAIYQSNYPERTGPIRSARDYYINVANGYDSFFVSHGYSPDALEMLDTGVIEHMNGIQYEGQWFVRSSDRVAPHNSYSGRELIEEGAEQRGASLEGAPAEMVFTQGEEKVDDGQSVQSFTVSYDDTSDVYTSTYDYDASTGTYSRISNAETTIDHETNEAVDISNIIILETDHQVMDQEGRLRIDLVSGGDAYVFQQGQWKAMTWRDVDGRMVPYLNGTPAPLSPGMSWIHIIPTSSGFEQSVTIHE